ncbi:MAG: hypothetical protein HS113_07695 [Verrucomicrobiales bacterium]|nr:hypothetical protein [Verrucomicrobiales bacterium]
MTAEQPGDPTYAPVRESRHFNGKQVVLSPLGGYDFTGVPVAVQMAGDRTVALGAGWDGGPMWGPASKSSTSAIRPGPRGSAA